MKDLDILKNDPDFQYQLSRQILHPLTILSSTRESILVVTNEIINDDPDLDALGAGKHRGKSRLQESLQEYLTKTLTQQIVPRNRCLIGCLVYVAARTAEGDTRLGTSTEHYGKYNLTITLHSSYPGRSNDDGWSVNDDGMENVGTKEGRFGLEPERATVQQGNQSSSDRWS